MSHDEDDTPELRVPAKRRPDTLWGDTKRINAGADHRRSPASQNRRQMAALMQPIEEQLGAPEPVYEDDITSPHELLERELSQSEIAVIARSRRDSGDPATYADIVKLAETLTRARKEERSNNKERADQLVELLSKEPGQAHKKLDERVQEIERPMRWIRWVAAGVLAGTTGMLLKVASFIADRSEREGETTIRLNHLENAVIRLESAIDRIARDRYSPTPDRAWPQHSSKDVTP